MNIFERLVSGYPKGDVSPQDFQRAMTYEKGINF